MVDQETIESAGRALVEAARSPARVVMFGSYARGTATNESDLDLLVIEDSLDNRLEETIRLRRALRPLRIPVDVLVYSKEHVDAWAGVRNTVIHAALQEGREIAAA